MDSSAQVALARSARALVRRGFSRELPLVMGEHVVPWDASSSLKRRLDPVAEATDGGGTRDPLELSEPCGEALPSRT